MKEKWLNLILRLTNLIYQKKQLVLSNEGRKVVFFVLQVVVLEILLLFFSLPIYLSTRPSRMVAFTESKGGYERLAVDYRVRQILTLTGVSIILIIWIIKFLVIFSTPTFFGHLELYKVSELGPVEIGTTEIEKDFKLQSMKVWDELEVPKIERVEKIKNYDYVIHGKGIPNEKIYLYLTDQQTLIYEGEINEKGEWSITHSQKDLKLKEGVHLIYAFNFVEKDALRSKLTAKQYFRVKIPFMEKLSNNIDGLANWSVGFIVVVGILLTLLTI